MKKLLYSLILILSVHLSFGNVAQPGMWNTGYGTRFTPIFDADTIHYGKIEMQKELVLVNLYPGFAAVKGEYWMRNSTDKAITMNVGYPVNGSYEQDRIGNVMYEDLYNIKVIADGKEIPTSNTGDTLADELNYQKWYYWKTTFLPNTVTKITVYFLTDNSRASLRKGYDSENANAFTYILESGRAWGGNIGNGNIFIQLKDGLSFKNIRGLLSGNTLKGDDTHIQFSFSNLEPLPSDNILIWYDRLNKENFDFKTITNKANTYFADLDNFPISEFEQASFRILNKENFTVKDTASKIFWGVIILIAVIGAAIIAGVVYLVYRLVKKVARK